MEIYLIRHGETTGDVEDRFGGDYEDHLTEKGQHQAQRLAQKLAGKDIQVIFTSPRIRAQETAHILKQKLAVNVKILDNIRERNHYGIMTGMVKSEAKKKYPNQFEKLVDTHKTVKGGENYTSFGKRVRQALKEALTSNYQTIAIISHGGPIRYIFREILNRGEIDIGDCGFTQLNYDGGRVDVLALDGIILQTS